MNKIIEVLSSFSNSKSGFFLPLLLLLVVISHLPYMNLPASGNHVWRQCNTLAVARNYSEEDMNILYPRVDKRYNKSGITGPQFTAYDWTLAIIYKAFGFSENVHRWFSLCIMLLAICGMYFLALQYTNIRQIAAISAIFLAFLPELYYHSINAVPDILALAAMIWAWYCARKWLDSSGWAYCLLSAILFALAGMVKMQFLVAGIAVGIEFLRKRGFGLKRIFQAGLLLVVAIVPTIWWYAYAAHLVKIYGIHEFVHAIRHARNAAELFSILVRTVFSDFPETFVGYAFLLFFVWGVIKSRNHWSQFPGLLAYGFGCILFYFLVQNQFIHHGYYAIIFFPLFALATGFGFYKINQSKYAALALIIFFAPVWAWLRMHSNWELKHSRYPAAFARKSFRDSAAKLSDTSIRWIVGPDETGCVYFYFLHAKGFPWDNKELDKGEFNNAILKGARGIVTNDTASLYNAKGNVELRKVGQADGFYWYRVQ